MHDHAQWLFFVDNFEHVFEREWLEIQAVGGVVVGRYRLRVAVDHDGFVTVLAQGQRSVYAAVVKLNALTDAVGAATQNHDFFVGSRLGLTLATFGFVGRIKVSGIGGELGRAGVHTFVNRPYLQGAALLADGGVCGFELAGQTTV